MPPPSRHCAGERRHRSLFAEVKRAARLPALGRRRARVGAPAAGGASDAPCGGLPPNLVSGANPAGDIAEDGVETRRARQWQ